MSHFTVLVTGEDVELALRPFQENNMGDCPHEYLEFNDIEDEHLHDYETKTCSRIKLPDGVMVGAYDQRFANPNRTPDAEQWIYPEGAEKVQVPLKEVYPTFENYMTEYCGSRGRDEEMGRYGYWENPNAKWDWYQVGGRWAGMFLIKPEFLSEYADKIPNYSWGWDAEAISQVAGENRVDSALKKHIDFARMRAVAEKEAGETWDKVHAVIDPLPPIVPWDVVRDERFKGDIEAARKFYHEQEPIVKLSEWNVANKYPLGLLMKIDALLVPREVYVLRAGENELACFAFLHEGKWAERGNMGWFGLTSNEKDPETWSSIFVKFLESLPDNERLTCVDCHI